MELHPRQPVFLSRMSLHDWLREDILVSQALNCIKSSGSSMLVDGMKLSWRPVLQLMNKVSYQSKNCSLHVKDNNRAITKFFTQTTNIREADSSITHESSTSKNIIIHKNRSSTVAKKRSLSDVSPDSTNFSPLKKKCEKLDSVKKCYASQQDVIKASNSVQEKKDHVLALELQRAINHEERQKKKKTPVKRITDYFS